jgi:SPP1 family phage portal protein
LRVYTIPARKWDEADPDRNVISQLVMKHREEVPRMARLEEYYLGQHAILESEKENKLVCNHAKDIVDTATSYFIGNPVTYKSQDDDIGTLTEELRAAEADEADGDNGLDLSIYGRAYEYIFTEEGETRLRVKNLSPQNTFMVYDDSIEQRELFAVYYYVQRDDSGTVGNEHYIATVLTRNYKWEYDLTKVPSQSSLISGPEPHYKGEVPVVEYLNNKNALGDFELQISLIDAYNALMSDRIADKEQFIDAILALYGTMLSDGDEEGDGGDKASERAMNALRKKKLLELPDGTKAEYLTRTFDEAGVEVLKRALEQDIHKFSHIPCLTDESFGGNVSGVAMEFKLLGMENITKIKTRYYRRGLRKRIRIFCRFMSTASRGSIDPMSVTAEFTRAMPKNLLEISQVSVNLTDLVSRKTLLSQIPFVDDPDAEIEAVDKERQASIQMQKEAFGEMPNTPPAEPAGEEPAEGPEDEEEDARRRELS